MGQIGSGLPALSRHCRAHCADHSIFSHIKCFPCHEKKHEFYRPDDPPHPCCRFRRIILHGNRRRCFGLRVACPGRNIRAYQPRQFLPDLLITEDVNHAQDGAKMKGSFKKAALWPLNLHFLPPDIAEPFPVWSAPKAGIENRTPKAIVYCHSKNPRRCFGRFLW